MPMESTGAGVVTGFGCGTWLERPSAVSIGKIGFHYYVVNASPTNPNTEWVTDLELGVLTWVFVGGTGGGAFGAMKYFVNNSPIAAPQPLCLYTSIVVAIAAAVADLHDVTSPAVIWVCPGVYTENIQMVAGISVQGMVPDHQDPLSAGTGTSARIIGIVDCGIAAGSTSLSNLVIIGQVLIDGAAAIGVVMNEVKIIQRSEDIGALTPLSITNVNALLNMNSCSIQSVAVPTVPMISISVAASLLAFDLLVVTALGSVSVAIVAGSMSCRSSSFFGSFTIDAGSITLTESRVATTAASAALSNAGTLSMYRCIVSHGGTDTATGAGTLTTIDCTFPAGLTGEAAATTSATNYTNRQRTEFPFEGAGPYTVTTLFDTYLIDTASGGAANKTVNLPALNRVPIGTVIRIQKQISILNTVTLVRSGANTFGGIAADWVLAAGSLTGVSIQAGVSDWRIVAN